MDVLSPDLLWIDDRCYRLPVLDPAAESPRREVDDWVESESLYDCVEENFEEQDDEFHEVEKLPNDKFKLSLLISQTFWSKIIGSKGVTKKRIENDTNTTIMIPRPMEHGNIVIKGTSPSSLILAKKNIEAIVFSSRQKLVFTHFISIPMNCDEIKKNFLIFKAASSIVVIGYIFFGLVTLLRNDNDKILKLFGKDRGVDESIFQNPDKLHLTIGTLVLTDQSERNLAEKLLHDVYEKSIQPLISNNKKIMLEMKGIEYMNDDPAEVDVLYSKIISKDQNDIIQILADKILQYFNHHKLLKSEEKEEVKLHVTLMNTLFRQEEPDELNVEAEDAVPKNKLYRKQRRTFNATNILQNFHDFNFGQQELTSIQLSVRFSTSKSGYYKSSCVINL